MNVEIEAEAALLLTREYINGIAVAVYLEHPGECRGGSVLRVVRTNIKRSVGVQFLLPPVQSEVTRTMDPRLNMQLIESPKFIWAPCAQLYSLAETETTQPPPPSSSRIWAHIRGRYWSAKVDDVSV